MSGKEVPKHFQRQHVFPLPGEKVEPRKIATMRFMSREEIVEKYAKAGIYHTAAELDEMMGRIAESRNKKTYGKNSGRFQKEGY